MPSLKNIAPVFLAFTLPWASQAGATLIADFEGADYGTWIPSGEAFGPGPARGSIHGQMAVEGFLGKGLVNSYFKGDASKGRLTSPHFRIEKPFITFLIGGGGHAETRMELLIAGKPVRVAAGPNIEAGGAERLSPAAWDVSEFIGREASIVIIDEATGGWGHINVDHLQQTDDKGNAPLAVGFKAPPEEITRELEISADFLELPVMGREQRNRAGLDKLSMELDGKVVRYLHVDLAEGSEIPLMTYSYDVREFRGKKLRLRYRAHDAMVLQGLKLVSTERREAKAYAGMHRPQFHFSPRVGWMNDINGTYYHNGLYHLFYQYNPVNRGSGAGFDMHWGHSVSKDLLTWEEWPVALFPNGEGQCYSGTTVVTSGAVPGLTTEKAPVLFFAATTPFSQHIATTPDGGNSWQRYAGNPVIPNMGDGDRDPKVIWHAASQHYCMVLYVGGPDTYRFLRSKDLKKWEETSRIPGWFECPEFFPVKSTVTGEQLYLLYGCYRSAKDAPKPFNSNSCYQLGRFDGLKFTPVGDYKHAHEGPHFYGALVFDNQPEGRQIMMGWTRGSALPPGEKFNQFASVPLELTLKNKGGGDTLCYEPIKELNALRGQPILEVKKASMATLQAKLASLANDALLDILVQFPANSPASFRIRNLTFTYDPATKAIELGKQSTTIHPEGDSVDVRFLVDRGIVESFWNGGEASYCAGTDPASPGHVFEISNTTGLDSATVYPLRSIWP